MKKSNKQDPADRSAIERMKTETAAEVQGYYGDGKAANMGKRDGEMIQKMFAEGEVAAENLGTATIDNEYNS
jgi:hypothetical protein